MASFISTIINEQRMGFLCCAREEGLDDEMEGKRRIDVGGKPGDSMRLKIEIALAEAGLGWGYDHADE